MAEKHSYTDILIIGAGPSGRMLAACLARQNINVRIIERRQTQILTGQADGINSRSLEFFQSLGSLSDILKDSASLPAKSAWSAGQDGVIRRRASGYRIEGVYTHFGTHCRSQGRTEKDLERTISMYSTMKIEYAVAAVKLEINENDAESEDAYPVSVSIRRLSNQESVPFEPRSHTKKLGEFPNAENTQTSSFRRRPTVPQEGDEIIHAKYVVGCDGGSSWTRQQLGIGMVGKLRNDNWGVLDVIPVTNFPDARHVCLIQSLEGTIVWIPREHGLIRMCIQLSTTDDDSEEYDRSSVTVSQILSKAQMILAPYKLDYRFCDWWAVYRVGERIASTFNHPSMRVFLAGDAVHTHSPKVGLGMNTSMADSWNLAWKLAAVVNKESPRSILRSYETERKPVAENLLHFAGFTGRVLSGKPSPEELQAIDRAGSDFTAGTQIAYGPSVVVSDLKGISTASEEQLYSNAGASNDNTTMSQATAEKYVIPDPVKPMSHPLAPKLRLGLRIPPYPIKHQASFVHTDMLQVLPADGRWRLIVFAGDINQATQLSRVNNFGEALANYQTGLLKRYTHVQCMPLGRPFNYTSALPDMDLVQPTSKRVPLIEVLTVHACNKRTAESFDLHYAFIPSDETTGVNYNTMFADAGIYGGFGIDGTGPGCVVLCRPDQHVAWVGGLDDLDHLQLFLEGCLTDRGGGGGGDDTATTIKPHL